MDSLPINIGAQPQLFVDNHLIEMVNFVTRTMHRPRKHDANPVLRKDKPWEMVPYFRTNCWNVRHDPAERLYRCWYEDIGMDLATFLTSERFSIGAISFAFHNACRNRMLYAESADGIRWTKPELDYRVVDGRRTNICLGDDDFGKVHAFSIIDDPLEDDPQKRFKSLIWHEHKGVEDSTIRAIHSADGRTWRMHDDPVSFGWIRERALGDVIILYPDTVSGHYYLDTRQRAMQARRSNPRLPDVTGWGDPYWPDDRFGMSKRRIFTTRSRTILDWPVLDEALTPDDEHDNLDDEFYGLTRFRIGDLWLGFLDVFQRTHNTKDIRLVSSRDGFHWRHVSREPFLDRGAEGSWDCYMVETCNTPLFLDDEILIYYGGSNLHHDWWEEGVLEGLDVPEAQPDFTGGETALGVATLRPEGFVSVDATVREGILSTKAFIGGGDRLLINARCAPGGSVDVELAGIDDQPVRGFERAHCDTFRGDAVSCPVSWSGARRLPQAVASHGAKLRFYLRQASLFSFRLAGE